MVQEIHKKAVNYNWLYWVRLQPAFYVAAVKTENFHLSLWLQSRKTAFPLYEVERGAEAQSMSKTSGVCGIKNSA